MNRRETKIMEVLKALASSNQGASNASVAACIVYKNSIISFGVNSYKSHPFQKKFGKNDMAIYLHAEILAIYNALKRLSLDEIKKSSLYILRIKKDGSCGLSLPCDGCNRAIHTFEIKTVKYTIDNENIFYTKDFY